VLINEEIDDDAPVEDLSDLECAERAIKRREIQIQFPGFCAGNYEMILNILLEEVIGWGKREDRPMEKEGLFGMCEAICLALEEQGRKTHHGHMTIWIKNFRALRKKIYKKKKIRRNGKL